MLLQNIDSMDVIPVPIYRWADLVCLAVGTY